MGKTFKAILVDDEPGAIANLEKLLQACPEIKVVEVVTEAEKAVEIILEKDPALVFLDIQMPGKTGFEIARDLHEAGDPPIIIFVTGFDRMAIEAIRHAAFDFLVKPVNPVELNQAIGRLQSLPSQPDQIDRFRRLIERTLLKPKVKISTTGGFSLINPADIIYILADWNYSELFFSQGKSILATMNIGSWEESLPKNDFFRISRSLIINVNYLTKVNRKKRQALLIKDGEEHTFPIPVLNIRKLERFLDRD